MVDINAKPIPTPIPITIYNIYTKCGRCSGVGKLVEGTGDLSGGTITCPACNGTGEFLTGRIQQVTG